MKCFTLFVIGSFFINIISAQIIQAPKDKLDKDLLLKIPKGHLDNLIVQHITLEKTFPEAKFLFNTNKGKIYSLPLDNMPCLVAINNDPIATQMNLKDFKKIPNALPEQKIIPEYQAPQYFTPKIYK